MKSYTHQILITLIGISLFPFLSKAQITKKNKQRIFLQNGWILKGDTSLIEDGRKLRLESIDQQVFIFSLSEVDSIRSEKLFTGPGSQRKWRSHVQVGFLMHSPDPLPGVDPSLLGNFFSLSLQYSGIFYTEKGLGMGFGTGINLFNRGYIMPLFLDIRGDLGKGYIRPHVYGQIGTSYPLYGREEVTDPWGNILFEDFKAEGGLLLEIGAGLKFLAKENYAWTLSLGWRLQEISEDYKQWEIRYKDDYSFQRISFQIGFIF
ncbi:MAG: hypothetical protein AAFR87_15495 [Bacteroidota bacterium]